MTIFRNILSFLLSLKTAIALTLALLGLFLYGSFAMPLNQEFQLHHVTPLLPWMVENPLSITWWLWASFVIVSLLAANTLFCSIQSLIRKRDTTQWLLVISPQVIHAGFLFILLAHLLSSYGSFKGTTFVAKGSELPLPNGLTVFFEAINAESDPAGFIRDWSAEVKYFREGRQVASDVIQPNNPSFQNGLGLYIKTVRFDPYPVALIEVSREPGALWALVGGMLFMIGTITLLMLKIRREEI